MTIAIGCDEAGCALKDVLKAFLVENGQEVDDFGTFDNRPVLYPDIAHDLAKSVQEGKNGRGILICGTGIGMAISANKVPGIRAALCHDTYSAERARKSNNAQIITLGARVIGPELAKTIIRTWLDAEFEDGRSTPKVNRINELEKLEMGAAQ